MAIKYQQFLINSTSELSLIIKHDTANESIYLIGKQRKEAMKGTSRCTEDD
jgi:hypothetical protein